MALDLDAEHNDLSHTVIAAAIEAHRELGPGLLEGCYEQALVLELRARGLLYIRQASVPFRYKGSFIGEGRLDLLVEGKVVLELKSVDHLMPIHSAQLLTYLRLADLRLGLLINFNVQMLTRGLKRIINTPRRSASPHLRGEGPSSPSQGSSALA